MLTPEEFNSEDYRIYWPAILVVFVVQMIAVIALSVAVANHSSPPSAGSQDLRAERNTADPTPAKDGDLPLATPNLSVDLRRVKSPSPQVFQ
jgi:hypothetical protein